MSGKPRPRRRDALAVRLCNLILRLLASEDYRRRLTAVIWRGLEQTEGDER